jgi:hypothetical protein
MCLLQFPVIFVISVRYLAVIGYIYKVRGKRVFVYDFSGTPPFTVLYTLKCILYKTIPVQAWAGPESSRSLRLPDFKTIGI